MAWKVEDLILIFTFLNKYNFWALDFDYISLFLPQVAQLSFQSFYGALTPNILKMAGAKEKSLEAAGIKLRTSKSWANSVNHSTTITASFQKNMFLEVLPQKKLRVSFLVDLILLEEKKKK